MMPFRGALVALLLLAAAGPARATGAWTTWVRPYTFTDALSVGDTVWMTSLEAGLLNWSAASGRFTTVTREPGALASNALTALARDRIGRLWVGTLDAGVSRLSADGRRWDLVNALDGLPGGAVTSLTAVGDTIWIGTEQGVALWDGHQIAGALPEGVNPSPFASDHVTGVVQRGDSVWVATQAGVYRSRVSTALTQWVTVNDSLPLTTVDALTSDGTTLLALQQDNVWRLDETRNAWVRTSFLGRVQHLIGHDGVVLATADNGVFRWNNNGWLIVNPSRPTYDSHDNQLLGTAYVATVDTRQHDLYGIFAVNLDGLQVWNGTSFVTSKPDLPVGNDVQNIALQGARTYAATFDEGFTRFDGRTWRNWDVGGCSGAECDTTFRNSAFAFSLVIDKSGDKWVGTWSTSVDRLDDGVSPPQVAHYFPQPNATYDQRYTFGWSSAVDSTGNVWIGLDSYDRDGLPPLGMLQFDPAGNFVRLHRPAVTPMDAGQVRAISADDRGQLWVGYAGHGLDVFAIPPPGDTTLTEITDLIATSSQDVFGIEARRESTWVMISSGVQLYSTGGHSPVGTALPLAGPPAPRGACHPLDVAPDGSVWVGTTAGLRVYRPGGAFQDFTTDNSPIANDEVRAVRVDQTTGVVWVGTSSGINRYDPHYVAPVPVGPAGLTLSIYPNPARLTALGAGLRLLAGTGGRFQGAVYDVTGRVLRHVDVQDGGVVWDGLDGDGTPVKPGLYFVRLEAGGHAATVRVALLH